MVNITKPFPYQELKRKSVDGKRLYENPWGEAVPSVTTILDKTKPLKARMALQKWKERVGVEEAQRITTEAADNGTRMHAILEYWCKNEEYTGETTPLSKMMANVIIDNIQDDLDEVWGTEVNLCAPGLYAGTTDLVGVYKGKPTIMDFKQTNKPKKRDWIDDYFLQGTAYALAHNELYGTEIENIAIFMCSRECQWQLFEVDTEEFKRWSLNWGIRLEQFYGI